MAPNVEAIIQEGISAIKAGRKDDARRALMKAVDLDERNETAWLWLSAVVDTPDEQQLCLENVLSINPSNQKAQRGLEALKKASGQKPKPAAPPAPPPASAAASPFDSSFDNSFDSNPFAGTGFDSNPYGSSAADPALGSGWGGFDAADSAASAPATSVDWNRGRGPAAYGSGKEVQLPSSEEYDNWVSGLQLGGNSIANEASFGSSFDSSFDPSSGPFASSFDDSADPFGGSSGSAVQDPFGANQGAVDPFGAPATRSSSPFGDFDAPGAPSFDNDSFGGSDDLFNAGSADPFGGSSAFGTPGRSDPFAASDPFDKPAPTAGAPSRASSDPFGGPFAAPAADAFDAFDADPVADLFSSVPGPGATKARPPAAPPPTPTSSNPFGPSQPSVFGGASPALDVDSGAPAAAGVFEFIGAGASGMQAYFKAIPPEIQPAKRRSQSGGGNARLVLTVIVLAVLNMVSLAYLVKTLMGR
jgi:hypothetical protein